MANRAGVNAHHQQLSSQITTQEQEREELQLILLFEGPEAAPMGIPLSVASRLEKFPRSAVSKVGNQYVVQYRDTILSLVDLYSVFLEGDRLKGAIAINEQDDLLDVVVVSLDRQHSIGLVLDRIIDIQDVQKIIRDRAKTRIPLAPPDICGAQIKRSTNRDGYRSATQVGHKQGDRTANFYYQRRAN